MYNILDSFRKIADNEGIRITQLEKSIGASKGVLSRAISNKSDIQSKWIMKLVENYPQYSKEWILTGKGAMLEEDRVSSIKEDPNGIPLIPMDAMAGFGEGELQIMDYQLKRYHVPEFEALKADYLIRVKGDSMTPHYQSGDIVACRKLPLTDLFFQWNKVYVLDTDQGPLIKRIHRSEKKDHIRCISENIKYYPFDIPTKIINAIAIVVGIIRLE